MSTVASIWLIILALLGASSFRFQDERRKWARLAFIVVASAFVVYSLVFIQARGGRLFKAQSVLESDRAEILLRLGTSIKVAEAKLLSMVGPLEGSASGHMLTEKDFHEEASTILEEDINKNPDSNLIKSKLVIVLGDSGRPQGKERLLKLAHELSLRKEPNESSLGKALLSIYGDTRVSLSSSLELSKVFVRELPPGWYRDATLLRLYKVAGETKQYNELFTSIYDRAYRLFSNFVIVVSVGILASFIAFVVVVVQIFLLKRSSPREENEVAATDPVPWSLKTVYVVFVLWLLTQILVGSFSAGWMKSWGLLTSGALIAAVSTAALYLISNGPAVLYAYLLAFKPYRVGFLEAIWLRAHIGKMGPFRLILSGLLTWCVAVPTVMIAYLIASRFFGSQGSSNPIIALVLEAARSSNYMATALFYITLGVLAPLCEETLFRGFLYRTLRNKFSVGTSLFVSASIFALVHMDMGALVPLLCLGWLFGFVFERTKSLLPSIVAHGLWNSGTFTLVLMIFGT